MKLWRQANCLLSRFLVFNLSEPGKGTLVRKSYPFTDWSLSTKLRFPQRIISEWRNVQLQCSLLFKSALRSTLHTSLKSYDLQLVSYSFSVSDCDLGISWNITSPDIVLSCAGNIHDLVPSVHMRMMGLYGPRCHWINILNTLAGRAMGKLHTDARCW